VSDYDHLSAERRALCELLEAAGVDPDRVPDEAAITAEGYYYVNADGPIVGNRLSWEFHPWEATRKQVAGIVKAAGRVKPWDVAA
jgi:hypothetical protein